MTRVVKESDRRRGEVGGGLEREGDKQTFRQTEGQTGRHDNQLLDHSYLMPGLTRLGYVIST